MKQRGNPLIGRRGICGAFVPETKSLATDAALFVERLKMWSSTSRRGVALVDFGGSWATYHAVEVRRAGQDPLFALLHFAYPLVGFATRIDTFRKAFIDQDGLSELLAGDYEVYDADSLNAPLAMTEEIRPYFDDQRSVRAYKPRCVGDVVFNEWD